MLDYIFLGFFSLVLIIILISAIRNKIVFKLGFRNIMRRKGYTLIVILGLMVGTGVISSSLVIGDTMDNMIESEIIKNLHLIDEIIVGKKSSGENDYFNISIFTDYKKQLNVGFVDGISPQISDRVAILNLDTNLSEPSISFYGVGFNNSKNFGSFFNTKNEKITDLKMNEIMIGEDTAEDLDARIGHQVIIYAQNTPHTFEISHILISKQRCSGTGIFTNLLNAQKILKKQGMINQIIISNKGGIYGGMDYTRDIIEKFKNIDIADNLDFELSVIKKNILKENKENLQQFTDLFTIFGTFSIIAGIILIINIFVMLGEERKSEMGMARAIGMKTKQLRDMYIYEGLIYAILASFVGVFFGIGIGYLIIFSMEEIFKSFGSITILENFSFTISSLIFGYVAGFLITIFTIYITSNRIAKLNIVRAIRDIPEPKIPKGDKRLTILGFVSISIGFLLTISGILAEQFSLLLTGISLIILSLGIITRRWFGDRVSFTSAGLMTLIFWLLPSDIFPDYDGGIELFIISGLFMVFSSLLIIMFNSEYIVKGITFLVGRGKSRQAVLKTAIAYSLKSKFRTGMTIAIFALVIFTITTMSMIVGMLGTNIEKQVEKASGGYEIIAFGNINSPIDNFEQKLEEKGLLNNINKISSPFTGTVEININSSSNESKYYAMIGIDDNFINQNEFEFAKLEKGYKNEKEAWNAIKENSDFVIIDSSVIGNEFGPPSPFTLKIGDTIEIQDKNNEVIEKKIIGIIDTIVIQGIFSYKDFVIEEFDFTTSNYFMIGVKDGVNVVKTAKNIESNFLINGIQVIAVKSMVLQAISTLNQFFSLFDAFMGLGLIIGIAGLGIITIRSVHERRQEIGMMRAIGFKKNMIQSSFLIETAIVAAIGIIIGSILGIFTGYILWRDEFKDLNYDFVINWQPIVFMFIIAFIFTLLCIFPASRKASKIPPAEAIRYKG